MIATLFVVGYAHGRPCWITTHFHQRNQEELFTRTNTAHLRPGFAESFGSDKIAKLIEGGDPRFAQYRDRILINLETATLETARDFAEAVISSQSDKLAHEADTDSIGIGGHTHIAAVTPDGFRWLVPPKGFDDQTLAPPEAMP
jgi:hypothetical protein